MTKLLTAHFDEPKLHELETYRRLGGYEGLKKALSVTRQDLKSQFGDMIWDRCGNDELTKVQRP